MFSLQKQPPEAFCKKSVPKNFANFTGKHLYWSLFLIQLKAQKACNFIKKETSVQVLSREFCEIFKNTSFTEHLWMTVARTGECFQLKMKLWEKSGNEIILILFMCPQFSKLFLSITYSIVTGKYINICVNRYNSIKHL